MSWQLIETAQVPDGILELYRRGDVFMIRANGLELMSGLAHQSETALGLMAVQVARDPRPNILIGGLGLGYTSGGGGARHEGGRQPYRGRTLAGGDRLV
jgi:hypothetical protein